MTTNNDINLSPAGYKDIGRRVREAANALGKNAADIADEAECNQGTVQRLINGKIKRAPWHSTCSRILKAVGLDETIWFH